MRRHERVERADWRTPPSQRCRNPAEVVRGPLIEGDSVNRFDERADEAVEFSRASGFGAET